MWQADTDTEPCKMCPHTLAHHMYGACSLCLSGPCNSDGTEVGRLVKAIEKMSREKASPFKDNNGKLWYAIPSEDFRAVDEALTPFREDK